MLVLKNGFDGGTPNAAITPTNSGGASGSPFDVAASYNEFGTAITYSSVRAAHGALSAKMPLFSEMEWWLPEEDTSTGPRWMRAYFWLQKPTVAGEEYDAALRLLAGDNIRWQATIRLTSAGASLMLQAYDDTEFELVTLGTTSVAPALGQWIRVELRGTNASGTAAGEVRLYNNADSTGTPTATVTGSVHQTGEPWVVANIRYDGSTTGGVTPPDIWVDDIGFSDVTWLGVASISQTVTPAAIAATTSMPTPSISTGRTVRPDLIVAPWSLPEPEVTTEGSPIVAVDPDAIRATWSLPSPLVQAFKNVTISPDPIIAPWTIPAPSLEVPINPGDKITRTGQIEWNGFLLGGGTRYRWQQLDGWITDLPGIDSGNVPHPTRHGSYPGRKLAQERNVTFTGLIRARREDMQEAIDELLAATPILEDDTELPLAIRILNTTYIGYGSIIRRAVPVDKQVRLGLGRVTLQWVLSDPLLLSRELNSAVISDGTWQTVTNLGNAVTYPTIRCPGPATDPTVIVRRNTSLGVEERVLEFGLTVDTGKMLVIDTYYGTATIGDTNVMDKLSGSSVPVPDLVLPAGQSDIGYATAGGAQAATVLWRHAYL
ncbi:phage tail domain-containing protein [Microtetraspora niveoalba]|uniref:phage tail domain-containing protein n=1 Tax=Microtetraspora niveoalba TaxID=46175 RepID=UPI000830776A|nr:phage tail domain-containing protein [Microtetraspora niveoalba]